MRVHSTECLAEPSDGGFRDLTLQVRSAITDAGIRAGRVSVFAPEHGSAVFLNENESGLRADLERALARLAGGALVGSASVVVPVLESQPWMGDWQRVMAFAPQEGKGRFLIQVVGT